MNYCNNPSKNFLVALFLSVALCLLIDEVKGTAFEVRMYNKKGFEGRYIKLKVDNEPCINLPPAWDKQISSVDPLGCIILYAEPECRGLRRRLERWSWGSSSLKDISFENMISSISPCPVVKKIVISEDEL